MTDDFQSLIDAVTIETAPPPADAPKPAIQKVNYSHDGMINLILANRGITQNAIAAHYGYSASWVSQVMSSDAFQAKLAERAAEIMAAFDAQAPRYQGDEAIDTRAVMARPRTSAEGRS